MTSCNGEADIPISSTREGAKNGQDFASLWERSCDEERAAGSSTLPRDVTGLVNRVGHGLCQLRHRLHHVGANLLVHRPGKPAHEGVDCGERERMVDKKITMEVALRTGCSGVTGVGVA
jgi:hypothetical protein